MAAKKKTSKKKAKKTAKRKTTARKKASTARPRKKATARKTKAGPKKAARAAPAPDDEAVDDGAEDGADEVDEIPRSPRAAPPAAEVDAAPPPRPRGGRNTAGPAEDGADGEEEPSDGGRPTAGGLRRGRRRRLPAARRQEPSGNGGPEIPPLPEEADLPSFDGGSVPPPAPPVRGDEDPRTLLERVRRGRAHVSDLGRVPEADLLALAREEGMPFDEGERITDIAVRLVTHRVQRRGRGARGGRLRRGHDDDRPPAPSAAPLETVRVEGLLELHPDGYGFLRRVERGYSQHPEDVYVAAPLLRRLGLMPGHWIVGQAHRPRPGQAYLALQTVEEVNHQDPSVLEHLTPFKDLTVVYPDTRLPLEMGPNDLEMRIMDLFCPIGRGQRGLIVAPPRSGKTVLLTKLADAMATNSPDVDIVVLLVDERPEEVTNMRRSVRGEVVASTFDKPATNHVRVAELVMEKVKHMVELGRNVVLLLDSITRLGRAYNNVAGGSGRILTGGLDANALTKPKRFFGSARNVEGGGSLTIIATALVDTGSKLDQVIFEEFKGTGNMECVLSRDLSNARIWPAIDVPASGTRNEDLLLHPDEMARIVLLRRGVTGHDPQNVMLALRDKLKAYPTNAQFLMALSEGGLG